MMVPTMEKLFVNRMPSRLLQVLPRRVTAAGSSVTNRATAYMTVVTTPTPMMTRRAAVTMFSTSSNWFLRWA